MSDMFVRFLKKPQVDYILRQLQEQFDAIPDPDDELHSVYAPDGDLVFAAMDRGDGNFICRLHREVFEENPQLD